MQPIQNPPPPDIGPNSSGDAIVNLQNALLLLLQKERIRLPDDERRSAEEGLRREREQKVYREATARMVFAFREQFQLEPGETVDESTAGTLNRLLVESGAFDTPQSEWVVRGQVVDAGGPRNDIQVSVFDRDLFFRRNLANTGQLLGTDVTRKLPSRNEDGCFEIIFKTAQFATGDVPTNGDTRPDLIFALSKDGHALEDFQVYRLPDDQDFKEETLVAADDLILGIQARHLEEVRIFLPGGVAKRGLSEYERLMQAIEPLLPERAPTNANNAQREAIVGAALLRFDEEQHRDISFVARETGLNHFMIQRLVTAFRLALDPFENELPASIFYGLSRTRSASDVPRLARLSTEDLRMGLKQATEATADTPPIIPPFSSIDRLEESVQMIRRVLARCVPNFRSDGAPSLADLVGADLPDPEDQATLWHSFSDHEGTPTEFWEKLRNQPGFGDPEKIAKVKCRFQLGILTQNNIPLVNAIRTKYPDMATTGELAFHLDTKEKWTALLDDPELAIPIPEDVPGQPEERAANYAASLAGAIQVAHPTAAVANMVASLPPAQLANTQPAVAKFLADAVRQAQFDLVEDRINDLVTEHGDSLLKDIELKDRPVVIAQVKRLQRLFRLSAGPESMKALAEAGFNSARDLAELPPEVAMDMLTPLLGEATSRMVLNRAHNISAAAIHQYVFLNDAIHTDIPGGAI